MKRLCLAFLVLLSATACMTVPEESVIPTDGRTMIQIYHGASADEPVAQDATIRAMNENCQSGTAPDAVKRCIDVLKKAQRRRASEAADREAIDWGETDETYAGVSEPISAANAHQPVVPEHTKYLRHPEALNPDYIRSSSNEVRVLFPRLPNPDIEIFVFPHLATSNNVPVPGYSTVMPLYNSVQYAMPGESHSIDGME